MSRWKVECGFWWVAMQVDEQGREIPGTAKRFPTHAEALNYANRMARTAKPETVGNPTDPEQLAKELSKLGFRRTTIKDPSGAVCDLTATVRYRNSIYLKAGDDSFLLARHEWEPLAKFLLAAAKDKEKI